MTRTGSARHNNCSYGNSSELPHCILLNLSLQDNSLKHERHRRLLCIISFPFPYLSLSIIYTKCSKERF